ncbi:MAG: transposase [Betaproteobacteria bacterium]
MPRRARIIVPGIPVHAIQRGINRSPCFGEEEDRGFFLHHLGRLASEESCDIHAYCLMTNHVHLLLTPGREESCARLFRRLGLLHTQYTNRKYGRSGTLWEGRFRSCLVQSDFYLLACHRYIELNPVRAGIVADPAAYPWSSYRVNAEGDPSGLVKPHAEYLRLGREHYRSLFADHLDSAVVRDIRATTNSGYALGAEAFKREMAGLLGRRVSKGSPGRPPQTTQPKATEPGLL